MKRVEWRELPNIDDPELVGCCSAVQNARNSLLDLLRDALGQLSNHPVTLPTRCALAGLARIGEAVLSAEVLCQKNRVRDAAILILSIFELRLDLQYIALDTSRATTWIEHAEERVKPWSVKKQLRAVYANSDELETQRELYRKYSMVKHCNPVGGDLAFPMTVTVDTIGLDSEKSNSRWIRIHTFGLAWHILEASKAACEIFRDQGLRVGAHLEGIQHSVDELSRLNEVHIVRTLKSARSCADDSGGDT